MACVKSDDAEITYQMLGEGRPIVLLHPFPVHHQFWLPAIQPLMTRYRLILPDLRGHGNSTIGEGPATMSKHAADLVRVMDDAKVDRAGFATVSIGGYVFFEFWRRFRERVSSIALCNTKAPADSSEARAARLKSADEVLHSGTEQFFQSMLPKLIGKSTHDRRPDLVQDALAMMRKMSPASVAQVQQGMAARPDSVDILKSINVPSLIVAGEDDTLGGLADAELMHRNISSSQLRVIAQTGHYSPWERPQEVGELLREFFDSQRS